MSIGDILLVDDDPDILNSLTEILSALGAAQVTRASDGPQAVAALQQNAGALGARDFETLLGAWARVAPTAPAPIGLDFANGELRLRGVALAAPALAEATQALKAQGYALSATGADLTLRGAP